MPIKDVEEYLRDIEIKGTSDLNCGDAKSRQSSESSAFGEGHRESMGRLVEIRKSWGETET